MSIILVTGGAGYIGSAFVKAIKNKGNEVIVVDNLSKGKKELIKNTKLYEIDLKDKILEQVFIENKIDKIVHFASYKSVGESMSDAIKYSDNISGTINLLNMMVKYNVKKIIFSSSASVYGIPQKRIVDEDTKTDPINYYGFTKLECEKIIEWYNRVYGIDYLNLRYFNVAGDSGLNYIDPHAENIFPIIIEVISGKRKKLVIFGNDYDTPDGTGVRDYIDINDLVDAHLLALDSKYNGIVNLGTGKGYSVKELVENFIKLTGKNINYEFGERRAGDSAFLVASEKRAREVLGWNPKNNIDDMIKSTYDAYKNLLDQP